MTGDDFPWSPKAGAPADEALSEEQAVALALALGDGFTIYGHMEEGVNHPLTGLVDEPYFGAAVGTSGNVVPSKPEFYDRLRAEGLSEDEIADEFQEYLDDLVSEDAPDWRETNPFKFSIEPLRKYFSDQFCEFMDLDRSDYWAAPSASEFLDAFNPYTRIWFEIRILAEIENFYFYLEHMKKSSTPDGIMAMMAFDCCGTVGRMVEHYRWRFSYGPDALRGRASVSAARLGGISRAKSYEAKRQAVLARMAEYTAGGHTVSNAAILTYKGGLGSSPEANRKQWNRHNGKK